MHGESRLARALWILFLTALTAYVLLDFIHDPIVGSTGRAAEPDHDLTLWVAGSESSEPTRTLLDRAADALDRPEREARVKALDGGVTKAIKTFFGPRRPKGPRLLVVTSTTLSDLAAQRDDELVPGAAMDAATAQGLIARATPIGLLSADPLTLAVRPRSQVTTTNGLLKGMRAQPWARTVAIGDDTYSRANLAALVKIAREADVPGIAGSVPFKVHRSPADAVAAVLDRDAGVVLTTRSSIEPDARRGRLRALEWPAQVTTPSAWVALVADPRQPQSQIDALRRAVRELALDPSWRRALAREGRTPATIRAAELDVFLRRATARAGKLQRVVREVESE